MLCVIGLMMLFQASLGIRHCRNTNQKYCHHFINSSTIYDTLFSESSFSSVFVNPVEEAKFVVSPNLTRKIELFIKQSEKPFTVSGRIAYFWDITMLPSLNDSGCYNYLSTTEPRNVSLCNVAELNKCDAPLSRIAPFIFRSASGELLENITWLCPPTEVCCKYECCDKSNEQAPTIVGYVFVLFMIVLQLLCILIVWRLSRRQRAARLEKKLTAAAMRHGPIFPENRVQGQLESPRRDSVPDDPKFILNYPPLAVIHVHDRDRI